MDTYKVMYNGENIFKYEMDKEEIELIEDFRNELKVIWIEIGIEDIVAEGSSKNTRRFSDHHDFKLMLYRKYGFIAFCGERGIFHLMDGFPQEDRERAKYMLLKSEIEMVSFTYECKNRDELTLQWMEKKYKAKYDCRKAAFEYTLKTLKSIYLKADELTVLEYTNYLNRWFVYENWKFSYETYTFYEVGNDVEM